MNIWVVILIGIIWLILVTIFIVIDMFLETKEFNNGICKRCGNKLKRYGMNYDGTEEYWCGCCGNRIWVSWPMGTIEDKKGEDEE